MPAEVAEAHRPHRGSTVSDTIGVIFANADTRIDRGCEGHGSGQATETPWPGSGSELVIKGNLSAIPPVRRRTGAADPVLRFVPRRFVSSAVPYDDLVTWVGDHSFPAMKHDATTLDGEGEGEANTPAGPADFTWHFVARLSGA